MDELMEPIQRYQRQLLLPQVGKGGQEKLSAAKVLVIGAGGLGSSILYYLAAAGVGRLGIVDADVVDLTNLQRQILHWEQDIGKEKVTSAREKLQRFNSCIDLLAYPIFFDLRAARELISQYDLVLSAVDNMQTRDTINQGCIELGKTWIDGAVRSFSGVVTTFSPPCGPCFRCLYPKASPKSEKPIPIMGTLPGVIGTLQAQEAIKLILDIGTALIGKLLVYDALEARFEQVGVVANPDCTFCMAK